MIYEKKLNIGYSAIGKQGILKIVSIMNFLQDTASEHAAHMGVSGFDLARKNLGWVIFRYHIEILDHPFWQDKITIRTYRFSCRNLYEIRNLTITAENDKARDTFPPDSSKEYSTENKKYQDQTEYGTKNKNPGKKLVDARACWVMINKKNGRPVRLSRFMDDRNSCEHGDQGVDSCFPEIIKPEKIHYQLPFKVRMHDLDLNGHVNNAIFVEWAVETVPEEVLSRFFPAVIDVVFNKESLYGDTIISHTEISKPSGLPITYHSIIRQQDQAELASLNICWHPLPQTEKRTPFEAIR
ncbi:MAG: hypothetical protein HQK61_07720 [Desulfamplus sp.]|nr:hypothetical protein [Desulfamplus sp.]